MIQPKRRRTSSRHSLVKGTFGATLEHIPPAAIPTAVVPWLKVLQLYYYLNTTLKLEYNGTISELNEENSNDVIGIHFRKGPGISIPGKSIPSITCTEINNQLLKHPSTASLASVLYSSPKRWQLSQDSRLHVRSRDWISLSRF
ncbi:hypothetical protein ACHWQZ_G018937 [Mnemiopsis leidyi]